MNGFTSLQGFNAGQVDPNFGGAGFLPVSDERGWLVVLTQDNGFKPSKSGEGQYLELVIKGQEGQVAGVEGVLRLNLQHSKPNAVAAAQAQLSALCHVTGVLTPNTTADLFNKPFRVVSVLQDASKPEGYTQLADNGIRDVNGNKPGKAASGPTTAGPVAPQQPAPAQQQQQPAQPAQGGGQPGWGQPPADQQGQQGGGAPSWGSSGPAQGGAPGWAQG